MKVWVIVPVHNRPDLLRACLDSILPQIPARQVVVADDASTDPGMGEVLGWAERQRCHVLRQARNVGALPNIVSAVGWLEESETFPADDVVLIVDGDDQLLPGALEWVRRAFSGDALVAYGSFTAEPPDPGCPPARPLPADILEWGMVRAFTRDHGSFWNHPYAFRRRVFDVLRPDDFTLPDGTPIRHCYDTALMVPLLEAAGGRVVFIEDVIYQYTTGLDSAVHLLYREEANRENEHIVNQPRRYQPLEDS